MTPSLQHQAAFETSKRLLAQIVNEGLLRASILRINGDKTTWLWLRRPDYTSEQTKIKIVRVVVCPEIAGGIVTCEEVVSLLRPESLQPPIVLEEETGRLSIEYDPGALFSLLHKWFDRKVGVDLRDETIAELRNSAANQVQWLKIGKISHIPDIHSPSIAWEKTLLWGHPTHPWHRTCFAQPPLPAVTPDDIPDMVNPSITFLSVPRAALRITGPFENRLKPLLNKLHIPEPEAGRVIVPCLKQQLPSISMRFPDAVAISTIQPAQAQASIRTITISPEFEFPYHVKLSLACKITSALRTITPWTACGGLAVSQLLQELLPTDLWVFTEAAAVCGGQEDFNEAKHLACILRDNLESRAEANGERLILAAALTQKPVHEERCYAERLFGLGTLQKRKAWFQSYASCLLQLTLPPLARHGICLEAHGQNMVARFCRETGALRGFAIRDFGGLRLHMPSLGSYGHQLDDIFPGSAIKTNNLHDVWSKAHHTLIQTHLGQLVTALQLESQGGWAIVREQLCQILRSDDLSNGRDLCDFFMQDTMPFKCFIKMKLEGKYRDYVERDLPNVLLTE